jgi:glycerate-2-kinase
VREALAALPGSGSALWVIAAGKAAAAMADAAVQVLGDRVQGGLVVSPAPAPASGSLEVIVGQHPQPGPGSERGGRRALAIAEAVPEHAELLVLVSGGASSLLAVPADDLTLDDKRAATGVLLRAGADIYALNTVRKHLSVIKGGRLAAACRARSHTLVLSDVVGDDLSFIASGQPSPTRQPTRMRCGCSMSSADATRIHPGSLRTSWRVCGGRFRNRRRPETRACCSPTRGSLAVGMTRCAAQPGKRHASATRSASSTSRWLEKHVTRVLRLRDRQSRPPLTTSRPACVVASGETTVRVKGTGIGGRNQELALAAAEVIARARSSMVLASIGTDGIDGPTDAAGAIVDNSTVDRLAAVGLSVRGVLDDNNSYACFDRLGDLVRTGPSGTNVGDLQVFLLA